MMGNLHYPLGTSGAIVRRYILVVLIVLLIAPFFSFFSPSTATSKVNMLKPFTPHGVKVLVVSPANIYFKGGSYLIADLARYGFNVTQQTSDNASATNYLEDEKTRDLSQYDVVILHGSSAGLPPAIVTSEEANHFVNYGGILLVIGNALFRNETNPIMDWWDSFTSLPVQKIEQRLGVNFTGFFKGGAEVPYWHNNGTFTRINSSIAGPPSLSYVISSSDINYPVISQFALATNGANEIYEFKAVTGKATSGVTFYKNATGAVGIYIQGAYIYGRDLGGNQIGYYGLVDISSRARLMASLIAFALGADIDTVIKPQPLATVRLENLGGYGLTNGLLRDEIYLNASLSNFNSVANTDHIMPTVVFTDYPEFKPTYWQDVAPNILSQLTGEYRDWEYTSSLRNKNVTAMTQSQIEALIENIKGNYSAMEMNLFSTVTAPQGLWSQATLNAMSSKNLFLIDIPSGYYPENWWNLRVNSSVIVHMGKTMASQTFENFTQTDRNFLHWQYFGARDEFALAVLNGFPEFVYNVPNFRWNEVGTYSLRTVYENLTSEVPDIRFVPLMEAGLYFGNKWMHIENASRTGYTIEFDIDASAIPNVVSIDKGMLWLRINANESIQSVTIDNNPWFYFDSHSIRMPTPTSSSHVKIILGESPSPRVDGSRYKVVEASYNGYRLKVSISSAQDLNVSARLFLPKVGPFRNASWSVFSMEAQWSYDFDSESRILKFWAISDGFVTFEVGVFMSIQQTPPWYDSSVMLTLNVTGLQTDVQEVTLSYHVNDRWFNITMTLRDGLWVAAIPAMPYGTVVEYKVFVSDVLGHWLVSSTFSYDVIDETPPDVAVPTWEPLNPVADQPVSVEVSVTEPENASGVRDVILWYYLNGDISELAHAKSINMTHENGNAWSTIIPSQSSGTPVSFFIQAYDKAGNFKSTSHYGYRVDASLIPPLQILLLGIGFAGGIGVILYFVKFRKNKRQIGVSSQTRQCKMQ